MHYCLSFHIKHSKILKTKLEIQTIFKELEINMASVNLIVNACFCTKSTLKGLY